MALILNRKVRDFAEKILWSMGLAPDSGNSRASGRFGEWLGRRLMRKKGYRIVVSNWRSSSDHRQEIDLICRKDGILVFVEIRARSEKALVNGFHSLGRRKMKSLRAFFQSLLKGMQVQCSSLSFWRDRSRPSFGQGKQPKGFHHSVAIFA